MISYDDAIDELRTIGDLVRWAASSFTEAGLTFGHGADNAFDEAFALVRFSLQLPHDIPPYMINCRLTKAERRKAVDFINERISTGKPLAYITHEAQFAGLSFYVDERVLIPRSPIAELIQQHFEPWIDSDRVMRILDLCTGSACIATACAYAFPYAQVVATDISDDALVVANTNIEQHNISGRVTLIKSDVFSHLKKEDLPFDIIVGNPPYVNADDMARLTKEYHYEPVLGLEAGQDGLDVVSKILDGAHSYLADDGLLVVEVGNSANALIEKYPSTPFTWPNFEHGGQGVFVLSADQLPHKT